MPLSIGRSKLVSEGQRLRCFAVCDRAEGPIECELDLPAGATLAQALEQLHDRFGALIDWQHVATGVWGELQPGSYHLQADDRIEVYRPLLQDPRQARRERARRRR